jgi:hypothetical protein
MTMTHNEQEFAPPVARATVVLAKPIDGSQCLGCGFIRGSKRRHRVMPLFKLAIETMHSVTSFILCRDCVDLVQFDIHSGLRKN